MFAPDFSHSQINILASGSEILRLGEKCYRLILKRQSEAIQQIFNLQSSIFNSSLSGLGKMISKLVLSHLSGLSMPRLMRCRCLKPLYRRVRSNWYGKIGPGACPFVRRYGRQSNPAAIGAGWRATARNDSRRNRPMQR